ncbi:MAG: signal peptidase I [Patescibacteria group bacterium]|nr:signal peptidase I [Patescibacteria group bacterium]MDE1946057.1 signal peptidase I [Patescibacteria group bacterium]
MSPTKQFIKETLTIIILALVIVLPVRAFVAQPFVVSGDSMDTTFANGDYLIVDEVSYDFKAPARGDVVVFKVPAAGLAFEHQSTSSTVYYIKRIIGLPGETVEITGDAVKIYNAQNPNGFVLTEPYVNLGGGASSTTAFFENIHEKITLAPGQYFVMGDNRHNSADSRFWGVLPKTDIRGRALVELFPLTHMTLFPGRYTFTK